MPPSKSSNSYSRTEQAVKEAPHAAYVPASKGTEEAYRPQGSGMDHDSVFAELAPGIVGSGNMKHKQGADGDHWIPDTPPQGLAGD